MKVAYLQHGIVWEDPAANRAAIDSALDGIVADVVVLPETFTTGFSSHMAQLAEPADGPTLHWARQTAQRLDALLVGTWVVAEGGRAYNRMHMVQPDGQCHRYDKAHTFRMSSEADQICRGTARTTVEWRGWRIRAAVCYDLRFPLWLRNSFDGKRLDYDLLLLSANWPASRQQAWTTLLQARAIENMAYVVGVNRTGIDDEGIEYSGHSAAYDYCGRQVSCCQPGRPQMATVVLDRDELDRFRQRWPFYLDFDTSQ